MTTVKADSASGTPICGTSEIATVRGFHRQWQTPSAWRSRRGRCPIRQTAPQTGESERQARARAARGLMRMLGRGDGLSGERLQRHGKGDGEHQRIADDGKTAGTMERRSDDDSAA